MELLFLGGTGFVGRHMVATALERGHHVTLFTRNKTNTQVFPDVERLNGDRDGRLEALAGRQWDAVLDVNGYIPRIVAESSRLLINSVNRYLFVSAGNACDMPDALDDKIFIDENIPRKMIDNPASEEYWGTDYGGLKALCEQAVEEFFLDRSIILRLGVVAGPFDPTDRVTYWVDRVARGGDVLVPAKPDDPINFIDARDLAIFAILALENNLSGIFNTAGQTLTWSEWLDACKTVSGSDANFIWVDDVSFLSESVDLMSRPFGALPMMSGGGKRILFSSNKAVASGLEYRNCKETTKDILSWHSERKMDADESPESLVSRGRIALDWGSEDNGKYWMAGLTPEQEEALLQDWSKVTRG